MGEEGRRVGRGREGGVREVGEGKVGEREEFSTITQVGRNG